MDRTAIPSLLEFFRAAHEVGGPLDRRVWTILLVSDDEAEGYRLSRFLGCWLKSVIVQPCVERDAVNMAGTLTFDVVVGYRETIAEVALLTLRLRQVTPAPVFWLSAATLEATLALASVAIVQRESSGPDQNPGWTGSGISPHPNRGWWVSAGVVIK